jgi:L-rhamnose mutarotase
MDELPLHPVMQRWWAHMKDIMAANPDGSSVTTPLVEMFHLE